MPTKEKMPLTAKSSNGSQTQVFIEVLSFNASERRSRALKFAAAFFGCALLSAFIPILHFVLVPSFLIASFISFFVIHSKNQKVSALVGPCPQCNEQNHWQPSNTSFPQSFTCEACRKNLLVVN